MDSYPRFRKSELVKECLTAEIEGRPLPISLEDQSSTLDRKGVAGTNGVVGGTLGKKKVSYLSASVCVQTCFVCEYFL